MRTPSSTPGPALRWTRRLLVPLALLLACGPTDSRKAQPTELEDPPGRAREADSDAPTGAVTITAPDVFTVGLPSPITGRALGDVTHVEIRCDGWIIGLPAVDEHGNYTYEYAFREAGANRELTVKGFDLFDRFVTEAAQRISVVDAPPPELSVDVPASAVVGTPVRLEGAAGGSVVRVVVSVDGWDIANLEVESGGYAFDYTFDSPGTARQVLTTGINAADQAVVQLVHHIDVALPQEGGGGLGGSTASVTLNLPGTTTPGTSVPITGTASGAVVAVRVQIDGATVDTVPVQSGGFGTSFTFWSVATDREVQAFGLSASDQVIAEDTAYIDVSDGGTAPDPDPDPGPDPTPTTSWVTVSCPSSTTVGASTSFAGTVSGGIVRVEVQVDGWTIGSSPVWLGAYAISYSFTAAATNRQVVALGYDAQDQLRATANRTIDVAPAPTPSGGTTPGSVPQLPYFYQYANSINPGGSCQNTSMAMVLKYFGATGETPDQISQYWGTSQAQSVSGWQSVFNAEAAYFGLSVRDAGTTTGSITQLRSLLAAGTPVVVHGYFTGYGHVIVLLGYASGTYTAHDPAGEWNEIYQGGGYSGWHPTAGRFVTYSASALEHAIAPDGYVWMHELYNF